MLNTIRTFALVLVPVAAFVVGGCDLDFDNNDARADGNASPECSEVCDRWDECNPRDGFDPETCTDDCISEAETDDNFEADVEECVSCLDNADTCPGDFIVCFNECAGVIVESN
ncbi:MAG: hypothetical protein Q8O67_16230 [Deltaproteobacteria bacterium]|nr:hypothetical protein [Deltaproteobacteria bacterium]